ncbi:hypothetical protein [Brevibacillus marinus]|uniref:hypothetical protein n=1 Tax=Brevibacillus marinus TaxID=2496837 RepID=UPI000F81E611|nr:hypothetical protein [Brevibacillus marinus]
MDYLLIVFFYAAPFVSIAFFLKLLSVLEKLKTDQGISPGDSFWLTIMFTWLVCSIVWTAALK